MAIALKQIVPPLEAGTDLRFWFANNRDLLRSVQSTYTGYSRLGGKDRAAQGMPILDEAARKNLQDRRLKYVMLLAVDESELNEGLRALQAEVPGAVVASHNRLVSGEYALEAAVVNMPQARGDAHRRDAPQ
jgi:hypothetical protein